MEAIAPPTYPSLKYNLRIDQSSPAFAQLNTPRAFNHAPSASTMTSYESPPLTGPTFLERSRSERRTFEESPGQREHLSSPACIDADRGHIGAALAGGNDANARTGGIICTRYRAAFLRLRSRAAARSHIDHVMQHREPLCVCVCVRVCACACDLVVPPDCGHEMMPRPRVGCTHHVPLCVLSKKELLARVDGLLFGSSYILKVTWPPERLGRLGKETWVCRERVCYCFVAGNIVLFVVFHEVERSVGCNSFD